MRLHLGFAVSGLEGLRLDRLPLPIELRLEHGCRIVVRTPPEQLAPFAPLLMQGECPVDRDGLRAMPDILVRAHPDPDGEPLTVLDAPEIEFLLRAAADVTGAIAFLLGEPLHLSPFLTKELRNVFAAETDGDEAVLSALGARWPRTVVTPQSATEVFEACDISPELVEAIARRGAVRVYAEALRLETSSARYRELWRTLEFAFKAHGPDLVELLAQFPPSAEMGFDAQELRELLVLRNRASHAASRTGASDLAEVDRLAVAKLGRLWTLVDRVVLTKHEASSDLDVEELAPLAAYLGRDGRTRVLCDRRPEEWVAESQASRRFWL